MKKLFTFLAIALLGVVTWSCSYDDDDLWNTVNDLSGRVETMEEAVKKANTDIEALRKLVEAVQDNVRITSVDKTETGCTINFSDGTTATISNGKNGTDAPALSVKKDEDGVYYWALDGVIIEVDGHKIKADGADGITPQLRINPDSKEWEMSTDGGQNWTSMGVKAEGTNGDSIFSDVKDGDSEVVFTLADGETTIVIPKASTTGFAFVYPKELPLGSKGEENYFLFAFDQERTLTFTGDVTAVDLMNTPQGWTADIDLKTKSIKVKAPAFTQSYYTEGILSLVAIDAKGQTVLASARICAVDFSDPKAAFVLNEGNMTTENGSIIHITADGHVIDHAYWRMNSSELGNVTQDLFITDDKMYIISQNGGNDGMLVEADAKTLKNTAKFSKDELPGLSWPSHVAVIGRTAYIRDNAGIWTFDLDSKALTAVKNTKGALKNRMAVVGNKVFAPANKSVLVLENGAVVQTINMEGAVTGVIKSDTEGYLWVSCSTNPAQIIKLSASDYTMDKHSLNAGGVSSGWGATPGISAKGNEIYFCNNTSTIYRHDFATNTTETLGDVKSNIPNWGMIYSMPAVHPTTGEYYFNTILGYGWSFLTNDISVYNLSNGAPTMVADYQNYTHFPAGVFFPASF
ncbi:DUF5074 domain-containing protein [Alistipes sp.]|uniref:DUF5074 domain-containing protein n=1 Tax=Alistipes sp. TaxID=1872444 RepID=UPI0025C63A86|nr:DUF5074 domain-containing protein [Alistipes sp.]